MGKLSEIKRSFDESMMMRALALARRGSGFVHPNPMVGAVLVKEDKIVGFGWHRQAGASHAEIEALSMAGSAARGATLYVSLEPCNHYGRTPPCTESVIQAGVERVIFAMKDPNLQVRGGGVERLEQAGIEVIDGVLQKEALELNRTWVHWVTTGKPYVVLKLALSQDGKYTVPSSIGSPWISSQLSRYQVQRLRRHADAVMVGAKTVIADNPRLTNRSGQGKHPLRIVVDPELEVPLHAHVYRPLDLDEAGPVPSALVVTTTRASYQMRCQLELSGVEVLVLERSDGRVDLEALFEILGLRGIQSILCEGGGRLGMHLLKEHLCHRVVIYQAPMVIGGNTPSFFDELSRNKDMTPLSLLWSRMVGPDKLSVYEGKVSQVL